MAATDSRHIPDDYEETLRENVADMSEDMKEKTQAMFWMTPPSNPNVVMDVAQWWYNNGRGGNDPIYKHCIAHLAQQDIDRMTEPVGTWQDGRDYMVALGIEETDGPA